MTTRRARNIISRTADLAALAADRLDRGETDAQVAASLNDQMPGYEIKPRTVAAFRARDYETHARERLSRREAAAHVAMIMDGGAATYARAGQDLLARMFYDMISGRTSDLDSKDLIAVGKTLAKIREIEIAQLRAETEAARHAAADAASSAANDSTLTPAERQQKIKEALGIA